MTTPCSGTISLNSVRTELGQTGQITLNDASVRGLCGVSSGRIDLQDLYCKSDETYLNVAYPIATTDNLAFTTIGTQQVRSGNNMKIQPLHTWTSGLPTPYSQLHSANDGNDSTYFESYSQNGHNQNKFSIGRHIDDIPVGKSIIRAKIKFQCTLRNQTSVPQTHTGTTGCGFYRQPTSPTPHYVNCDATHQIYKSSNAELIDYVANTYQQAVTVTSYQTKTVMFEYEVTFANPYVVTSSSGWVYVYICADTLTQNIKFTSDKMKIYTVDFVFS